MAFQCLKSEQCFERYYINANARKILCESKSSCFLPGVWGRYIGGRVCHAGGKRKQKGHTGLKRHERQGGGVHNWRISSYNVYYMNTNICSMCMYVS
jgi:hypothetical protein